MDGTPRMVSEALLREMEAFVHHEALLADESRFDEWEALLADDMHYWIPIVTDAPPSEFDSSIVNDNRARLATRLRQLRTGTRHSQAPVSFLRRLISNMVVTELADDTFEIRANFVIYEYQRQSVGGIVVWPGRVIYRLRREPAGLKMFFKKVLLIHSSGPVPSLAFIA
jgi:3-phenylpropionate/cinnamic acid dioxygenase small subunit